MSDDHSGRDWRPLRNSFLTGVWAPTLSQGDLVRALAGGRDYTYHPNLCPGLGIDTMVDGVVTMGEAAVSSRTSGAPILAVTNLPAGATEVVRGPVDYAGQDPATTVMASIPASSFGTGGTGNAAIQVNTSTACFRRPQVRQSGTLLASGNPTWLLRHNLLTAHRTHAEHLTSRTGGRAVAVASGSRRRWPPDGRCLVTSPVAPVTCGAFRHIRAGCVVVTGTSRRGREQLRPLPVASGRGA